MPSSDDQTQGSTLSSRDHNMFFLSPVCGLLAPLIEPYQLKLLYGLSGLKR